MIPKLLDGQFQQINSEGCSEGILKNSRKISKETPGGISDEIHAGVPEEIPLECREKLLGEFRNKLLNEFLKNF